MAEIYPNGTAVIDVLANDVNATRRHADHHPYQRPAGRGRQYHHAGHRPAGHAERRRHPDRRSATAMSRMVNFTYTVASSTGQTRHRLRHRQFRALFRGGTLVRHAAGRSAGRNAVARRSGADQDDGPQPAALDRPARRSTARASFAPICIARRHLRRASRACCVSPLHRVLIRDSLAETAVRRARGAGRRARPGQ